MFFVAYAKQESVIYHKVMQTNQSCFIHLLWWQFCYHGDSDCELFVGEATTTFAYIIGKPIPIQVASHPSHSFFVYGYLCVAAGTLCHHHDPSVFLGMAFLESPFKNRLENWDLLRKLEYLVVILNMTTLLPRTCPIKRWFYKCFKPYVVSSWCYYILSCFQYSTWLVYLPWYCLSYVIDISPSGYTSAS